MFTLPPGYITIFDPLKPYFNSRIWSSVQLLLMGAILTPGQRTGSAEVHFQNYHRVKTLIERAQWMLRQVRHWLPKWFLVVVADNSFTAIELLAKMIALPELICMIVRFRLDAALYEPAPLRKLGRRGRPRKKGKRRPSLEQVAANPYTQWQTVTVAYWYG